MWAIFAVVGCTDSRLLACVGCSQCHGVRATAPDPESDLRICGRAPLPTLTTGKLVDQLCDRLGP